MPQTVHAFLESEDRSGAATYLAAIADDLCVTSGDNLRLREDMPLIALMYLWSNNATYEPVEAYLTSPKISNNPIQLLRGYGLNYVTESVVYDFRDNPLDRVRAGDNLRAYGYEDDQAGTAHYLGVALVVSDGRIPKGVCPQLTHIPKWTATATTAATWTQLAVTEANALEKGTYEMYGAAVQHAGAFAARFVFKGMEARPAVIPQVAQDDALHPFSAFWGKGIRFEAPDQLPDIEILETAGSGTVTIEPYLRKVA